MTKDEAEFVIEIFRENARNNGVGPEHYRLTKHGAAYQVEAGKPGSDGYFAVITTLQFLVIHVNNCINALGQQMTNQHQAQVNALSGGQTARATAKIVTPNGGILA